MTRSSRPPRAVFIGTCRMYDPLRCLRKSEDLILRASPHRIHTPTQVLQYIRHLGGDPQYRPETMHLVSDHAATEIFVNGLSRSYLLERLIPIMNLWKSFDVFVIEICALREFSATLERETFTVNTFAQRDQERYADQITQEARTGVSAPVLPIEMNRLTGGETHQLMAQIKMELDGRPIIWVSHQRPPDLPQYETANSVRKSLATTLKAGAELLGDRFFDPTEVARELGAEAFFQKDGTDIDHMTLAGAEALAVRYRQMILEDTGRG